MRLPYNSRPICCVGHVEPEKEGFSGQQFSEALLVSSQRALRGNGKLASSLHVWRACCEPGHRFRLTQSAKYPKRFLLQKKVRPANFQLLNLHSPPPHEETAKELRTRFCPSNCSRSRSDVDLGDTTGLYAQAACGWAATRQTSARCRGVGGPVSQNLDLRVLRYVPPSRKKTRFLSGAILSPWPEASIAA